MSSAGNSFDFGATIRGFTAKQQVFGRYTLTRLLGRGGMGVVWLARDDQLEREVALKFVPEVVAMDKEAVRDMKRETRRCLELTHTHIVRIYDFIQDPSAAAIAMEYIDGATLAARKVEQPNGHFEVADLQGWVEQALAALEYAHTRRKVVHRDIKPANLMVDGQGFLKVADFGIAASVTDSVSRVSAQNSGSGTAVYMSPQQMMGEKPAVTDDVYAVGATLYELLTGKPPFYSGTVLLQMQSKVPPTMTERRGHLGVANGGAIPVVWEETIAACLAKEASARPQSAGEVAERLGLVGSGTGSKQPAKPVLTVEVPAPQQAGASAAQPSLKAEETAGKKSKKPIQAGWLIALVLLVVGGGYYWGVYRPDQQRKAELMRLELAATRAAEEAAAKAAAAAKALKEAEEKAFSEIIAKIDAMVDSTSVSQRDETVGAVEVYTKSAPERFRGEVESQWTKRLASWTAAAAAKAQEEKNNKAYGDIIMKIEALLDGTAVEMRDSTAGAVTTYLGSSPVKYRADVDARWKERLEKWEAARLAAARGGVIVRTEPAGAEIFVGLYDHGVSPMAVREAKLGRYSVNTKLDGYEEFHGEVEVKESEISEVSTKLVRSTGSVVISSEPSGLSYEFSSSDATERGTTPASLRKMPTGDYTLTVTRPGWPEVKQTVKVERGVEAKGQAAFIGGNLEITSVPSGAEVYGAGEKLGVTPLKYGNMPPATFAFEFRIKGYKGAAVSGEIKSGETAQARVEMEKIGDWYRQLAEREIEGMGDAEERESKRFDVENARIEAGDINAVRSRLSSFSKPNANRLITRIAMHYAEQGNSRLALETSESIEEDNSRAIAFASVGEVYGKAGNREMAEAAFARARRLFEEYGRSDRDLFSRLFDSMVMAQCLTGAHLSEPAARYLDEAISVIRRYPEKERGVIIGIVAPITAKVGGVDGALRALALLKGARPLLTSTWENAWIMTAAEMAENGDLSGANQIIAAGRAAGAASGFVGFQEAAEKWLTDVSPDARASHHARFGNVDDAMAAFAAGLRVKGEFLLLSRTLSSNAGPSIVEALIKKGRRAEAERFINSIRAPADSDSTFKPHHEKAALETREKAMAKIAGSYAATDGTIAAEQYCRKLETPRARFLAWLEIDRVLSASAP